MTKKPLGVCDRHGIDFRHTEQDSCPNWRPVEASAPAEKSLENISERFHRIKHTLGRDAALRDLSGAPAAPPAREWPKCKWCHSDLVQFVKNSGKCPKCGALDFFESAAPKDQTQAIEESVQALREASRSLANEVAACTGMSEWELRGTLGNTNFTCLTTRMTEVRSALAALDAILPILRSKV